MIKSGIIGLGKMGISHCAILGAHPDVELVAVCDASSTMACTITAKKLCIDVAHVVAGIRSGDMSLREEINRTVTDAICDHFFTTTQLASGKLKKIE